MPIKSRIDKVSDMFGVFDDPMDKYTQIIEFGKKNKGLDAKNKTDENRIFGCASLAWVKTYNSKKNTYSIKTDSDTFIVKGLLNILEYIINDSTKKEIDELSVENILETLGMSNSITSQRTNGFLSALDKIKNQINE